MIILVGDQKHWAESVSRNDLKGRFIDLPPKKDGTPIRRM